jgi:hypothetical protein
VLLLTAIATFPPDGLYYAYAVPSAFMIAYGFVLGVGGWRTGANWHMYLLWLLGGMVVLLKDYPTLCFVTSFVILLIGHQTIRLALTDFPYTLDTRGKLGLAPVRQATAAASHWPASPLVLDKWYFRINARSAFLISIAIAWSVFCLAFHADTTRERDRALLMGHAYLTVFAVFGRLLLYVVGHMPPISLLGRLATRRWIIPRYDVIFAAPLLAAAAAFAMPTMLILRFGIPAVVAVPLSIVTTLTFAFGLPPRWQGWHFTGHYREYYPRRNSAKYVKM